MRAMYVVQAAAFSEGIHVGRVNAKGDGFAEKQDRTDMVLAAVAQYVRRNFDGGMTVDFQALGLLLDVRVRSLTSEESQP